MIVAMKRAQRSAILTITTMFLLLGAAFGGLGEGFSIPSLFTESTQSVLAIVSPNPNICKQCGAFHGGVYHPNYCHNCISKGITPIKPGASVKAPEAR